MPMSARSSRGEKEKKKHRYNKYKYLRTNRRQIDLFGRKERIISMLHEFDIDRLEILTSFVLCPATLIGQFDPFGGTYSVLETHPLLPPIHPGPFHSGDS